MDQNIKLSHVSLAVLGLIAEGESYPYELNKKIEERQMKNWTNIGQSSLYGVLNKLEQNQLIKSRITTSEQNRALKILTITDKGIQVLKETVFAILSRGGRLERDWDLAFSNIKILTDAEKIQALESCIESSQLNKQMLLERLKMGNEVFKGTPPLHFRGLFLRPLKLIDANIEFCNEVIAELKRKKGE